MCLKRLLKLPESTPEFVIYAESGLMPAEQQITKKKLLFLHRILWIYLNAGVMR